MLARDSVGNDFFLGAVIGKIVNFLLYINKVNLHYNKKTNIKLLKKLKHINISGGDFRLESERSPTLAREYVTRTILRRTGM